VKIRYRKVALSSGVAKTGYLYSTLGSNVQHAHDLNLSLLFSSSRRPHLEGRFGPPAVVPLPRRPPPLLAPRWSSLAASLKITSCLLAQLPTPPPQYLASQIHPYNSPPPHNGAQPPSPSLQSSSTSSWRCREAPTGAWGVTARWAAARGWQRNRRAAAPRGGQLILTEVCATERASAGLCFVLVW
jgi:hypothetical protein